jgi:hypothetical protein
VNCSWWRIGDLPPKFFKTSVAGRDNQIKEVIALSGIAAKTAALALVQK